MPFDFFSLSFLGFIDSSRRKVTVEHQTSPPSQTTLSPVDVPIARETTYLITSPDEDPSVNHRKVRFILQKSTMNGHSLNITRTNGNVAHADRPPLSLVEAVNGKYLDLSTGIFSSSSSSSSFSQANSIENNKNPPPSLLTPTDTQHTGTTTAITLKEAIDANILDAHSAYVVDTLEQR